MDPALVELIEAGRGEDEVAVILRLVDPKKVPDGVRIVARFGEICTARLRRAQIRDVWASPAARSVKAARALSPVPRPDISEEDNGSLETGVGVPRLPDIENAGRGIVIGFCDWGFDFTHDNFRNPDGTTRLRALWDQRGTHQHSPAPWGYGRVFTRDEINAALRTDDPCGALGYHPATGDPHDNGAHGTHVADIAAGNRRMPGSEVGLAGGAELVFVHLASDRLNVLANFGDSVRLLEGLDFIRKHGGDGPLCYHVSAGKTGGSHTGKTPFEQAVDALLTERDDVVLSQSVGNYARSRMHTHARIGPNGAHVLKWVIALEDRTPNELEVWYSGNDVYGAELHSPDGRRFSVRLGDRLRLAVDGERWGSFHHRKDEPNTHQNHIDIFLLPQAPAGTWELHLTGRVVVDGRVHAWIERDSRKHQSHFATEQATSRYTTNTICNSLRAIATGAYMQARPNRPPAPFSSRGPTADGRQKPELAAPGYRIRAARSLPRDGWDGQSRFTVKSGTSMAAPFVTGTCALMMQASPHPLSIHDIRSLLIGSVDPHPGPPGRTSSQLGYGYLNVEAAVEAARRFDRCLYV